MNTRLIYHGNDFAGAVDVGAPGRSEAPGAQGWEMPRAWGAAPGVPGRPEATGAGALTAGASTAGAGAGSSAFLHPTTERDKEATNIIATKMANIFFINGKHPFKDLITGMNPKASCWVLNTCLCGIIRLTNFKSLRF
jgi:hypothetical protein